MSSPDNVVLWELARDQQSTDLKVEEIGVLLTTSNDVQGGIGSLAGGF